jgi:hypothetical protein
MSPLPQAVPGWEAADRGDRRDCARTVRLRLGNCPIGAAGERLTRSRRQTPGRTIAASTHLKTEQGWGHGHGQENPRIHYQPDLIRCWLLDRGSSATGSVATFGVRSRVIGERARFTSQAAT